MDLIYRTMSIGDYEKASDLWSTSSGIVIRTSDSEKHVANYLSRNHHKRFVAESNGDIIGSILTGHDGKRGYIQNLVVSENHRSAGIGSHLVSLCIDSLSELDIVKSHIHDLDENVETRTF